MTNPLYGTARWKRRRMQQLLNEPLCRLCMVVSNRVTAATVADHVDRHEGDEDSFWNGELQSLCKQCHDSIKQQQEKSGTFRGCDINGRPLDKSHWWAKK